MKRVALTGPMYSGKSAVARELERNYGYTIINFTDILKSSLSRSLALAGAWVSVDDMHTHKARYRRLLQEWGSAIDFDTNPDYVHRALYTWVLQQHPGPVVFDNVRFPAQADCLSTYGFDVVRLDLPHACQIARAVALYPNEPLDSLIPSHAAEVRFPDEYVSMTVDACQPLPDIAADIYAYEAL